MASNSDYQKDREALFSKTPPKQNSSSSVALGENVSMLVLGREATKSSTFWFKKKGSSSLSCVIAPPNSTAGINIDGDLHFFINGSVYVVTADVAKNIVPNSSARFRISIGNGITDSDAIKHGTKYTHEEYRAAYSRILVDTPTGFGL